jgi:hypothetical protein
LSRLNAISREEVAMSRVCCAAAAFVAGLLVVLPSDAKEPQAKAVDPTKKIEQALERPVTWEFVETPLADVIDFICRDSDIQVRVDQPALDDVGLGTDTPISIKIKDLPLVSALELMLRDLDLTWTIWNGVLLITTPDKTEEELMLVRKVYPVGDLVLRGQWRGRPTEPPTEPSGMTDSHTGFFSVEEPFKSGAAASEPAKTRAQSGADLPFRTGAPEQPPQRHGDCLSDTLADFDALIEMIISTLNPKSSQENATRPGPQTPFDFVPGTDADFDSLILMIVSTVHPTTWDGVGGPATIQPYTVNGEEVLVIVQTYPVHRAIQRLFADLRAVKPRTTKAAD